MKQCPTCNRTYADDTLSYCLADGALLSAPYNPAKTPSGAQRRAANSRTEVLSAGLKASSPTEQSHNPILKYVIVALLALIIGGGVVVLIKSREKNSGPVDSKTAIPKPGESVNEKAPTGGAKQPDNANPVVSVPALTDESVNALINRWINAQNTQKFEEYASCYAYSFQGVLRTTSGRVEVFDFNKWMQTRRRMINQPGGIEVEARDIRITIVEDVATVEFNQYYRSSGYSDWGPKTMRISRTTDGAKIVYEELKSSHRL